MGTEWYYARGKDSVGPVTQEELASVIAADSKPEELLISQSQFSDWKRVREVSELASYINWQPEPIPSQMEAPELPPPIRLADKKPQVSNQARKSSYNFVALHWKGDLPLWVSYWMIAFFSNIAIVIIVAAITEAMASTGGFNPLIILTTLSSIWLFLIAAIVWHLVGVWRSANRYVVQKAAQNKSGLWGGLAKFAVIIGVLRAVAVVQAGYPQIEAAARMAFMNDPSLPDYSLRIMRGGTELEIAGGFKYGLDNDLERLLGAAPTVQTVHLNSGGGRIGEALKIFNRLKAKNLKTYTSTGCYSACTIAFMAGKERWLGANAKLGFHALSFSGMAAAEVAGADEQQRKIMLAAGAPSSFVARALSTPSSTMWYPSQAELSQANLITGVADSHQFAASGYGASTSRETFDTKFRNVPLFYALQKSNPKMYDDFIREFQSGYVAGESEGALLDHLRYKLMPVIRADIPLASDDTLFKMGQLYMRQLKALAAKDKRFCFVYLSDGNDGSLTKYIPQNMLDEELKLNEQVLLTAEPRTPNFSLTKELWGKVVANLTSRFGSKAGLIAKTSVNLSDQADYCDVGIAMYEEMLQLPSDQSVLILRDAFQR